MRAGRDGGQRSSSVIAVMLGPRRRHGQRPHFTSTELLFHSLARDFVGAPWWTRVSSYNIHKFTAKF